MHLSKTLGLLQEKFTAWMLPPQRELESLSNTKSMHGTCLLAEFAFENWNGCSRICCVFQALDTRGIKEKNKLLIFF